MNIGVYGFTVKRTQEQWSPDGPKDNHTALCSRIETQPSPLALAASFKREKNTCHKTETNSTAECIYSMNICMYIHMRIYVTIIKKNRLSTLEWRGHWRGRRMVHQMGWRENRKKGK